MKLIANTFVLVSTDCPVAKAAVPKSPAGKLAVHALQYELLTSRPYELTLEDLIFETYWRRAGLSAEEAAGRIHEIRAELFSVPHACMRASTLTKRYGWGAHYDEEGRLALYAMESAEYAQFAAGKTTGVKIVCAMRSKKA
ncbi:DUF6157 family protein [Fimbriiglobus ruber]|nr:DUF6157 family protein [Fimbriiglobus ruber]